MEKTTYKSVVLSLNAIILTLQLVGLALLADLTHAHSNDAVRTKLLALRCLLAFSVSALVGRLGSLSVWVYAERDAKFRLFMETTFWGKMISMAAPLTCIGFAGLLLGANMQTTGIAMQNADGTSYTAFAIHIVVYALSKGEIQLHHHHQFTHAQRDTVSMKPISVAFAGTAVLFTVCNFITQVISVVVTKQIQSSLIVYPNSSASDIRKAAHTLYVWNILGSILTGCFLLSYGLKSKVIWLNKAYGRLFVFETTDLGAMVNFFTYGATLPNVSIVAVYQHAGADLQIDMPPHVFASLKNLIILTALGFYSLLMSTFCIHVAVYLHQLRAQKYLKENEEEVSPLSL
jgi:hypothetical protein